MKINSLILVGMIILLCSFVSAAHDLPTDLVDDDIGLMEGMGIWAKNVTSGFFWSFMLLGFCIVLWMATARYGNERAFGYAGTVALFGSILLVMIGWIDWSHASILIIIGAIGIATMVRNK